MNKRKTGRRLQEPVVKKIFNLHTTLMNRIEKYGSEQDLCLVDALEQLVELGLSRAIRRDMLIEECVARLLEFGGNEELSRSARRAVVSAAETLREVH